MIFGGEAGREFISQPRVKGRKYSSVLSQAASMMGFSLNDGCEWLASSSYSELTDTCSHHVTLVKSDLYCLYNSAWLLNGSPLSWKVGRMFNDSSKLKK